METVYFQGQPMHTSGTVPAVGQVAPGFDLTTPELTEVRKGDYEGKRVVLNVFPSLDTPVCAASVRRFNQEAAGLDNTVVLCVSMDLPFAMARFCTVNEINGVQAVSAFRSPEFGQKYGLTLVDGALKGLLARAVIVIDENGKIAYRELVNEITNEPDYEAAISVLKA